MERLSATLLLSLLLFLLPSEGQAQEEQGFTLQASGFIWTETFYDSRQLVSSCEGSVLFFPAKRERDANGLDINASPEFSMINVHSRARVQMDLPEFLDAEVSGLLEVDFAGTAAQGVGLLRLRHAMLQLKWTKSELLFGQYWHPMFNPESFPQVVTWGAALPYHPLSRNAQIRYSYRPNSNSKLAVAISTQLDFRSPGPDGPSAKYMRDAGFPEVNASYLLGTDSKILMGATLGYKVLKPALSYVLNEEVYKCTATIGSYHLNLFTKIQLGKSTLRGGAIYGQNLYNFVMLGGYGVSGCSDTGEASYTNLTTGAYWLDFTSPSFKAQYKLGLYAGYTQNYGADAPIRGEVYARGTDIAHAFRLAPRVVYGSGKVRFRLETIYDMTAYGTPDIQYRVQDTEAVSNLRILFATSLHF